MLFLVGVVLGVAIAAARLAHQSGTLSRGWYRAVVAVAIVAALVVSALLLLDRMEGA